MIADQDENLIEFLNKRLRNQRKRLLKITKYEQLDIDTLNADQIETLARKQEVTSTIKELEDALAKATAQEKRNEELLAQLKRQHEAELEAKVQEATVKTFNSTRDELNHLLVIKYALALPTTHLIKQHPIGQSEFNALMVITKLITRKPEHAKDVVEFSYLIGEYIQKMFQGCEDIVPETELSFQEIDLLIRKLLAPPPQGPVFGVKDEDSVCTINGTEISNVVPEQRANFLNNPAVEFVFKTTTEKDLAFPNNDNGPKPKKSGKLNKKPTVKEKEKSEKSNDLPKKRVVKKTISGMTLTLHDTE